MHEQDPHATTSRNIRVKKVLTCSSTYVLLRIRFSYLVISTRTSKKSAQIAWLYIYFAYFLNVHQTMYHFYNSINQRKYILQVSGLKGYKQTVQIRARTTEIKSRQGFCALKASGSCFIFNLFKCTSASNSLLSVKSAPISFILRPPLGRRKLPVRFAEI